MRSLPVPRRSQLPRLAVAVVAVAALALAACGSDDGATSTGTSTTEADGSGATEPAPADDPLDGRVLVATSVTEAGEERALVEGTELRISFTAGQISVNAGCNQMVGGYAVVDGTLTVDTLGGTMMGCEEPLADQDAWIAGVLAEPGTVEAGGDEVTLTFGDTVLTLADVEAAALVGTTWTVDTLIQGSGPDGIASSVDPAVGASLTLAEDGTYAVATGCNTGGGSYQADEEAGTLTFELPRLTRMACTDDAAREVETALTTVLEGEATFELSELSLVLTRGETGVGFRTT